MLGKVNARLMLGLFFLLLFSFSLQSYGDVQSNILIYGEGDTQVTSEINKYAQVVEGMPILGSVMITHDAKNLVDNNSFRLGDKPLKVEFVQTIVMSSYSNLVLSIYKFQLAGMKKGVQNLAPIKVKVGGKDYQAPPLTIEIAG
jgi:hypothetical protein